MAANDMLSLLLDIVLDIDERVDFVFNLSCLFCREEATCCLRSRKLAHGGLFDNLWFETRITRQNVFHSVHGGLLNNVAS